MQEANFAADSALEGDGFEPSVPGTKEPVFVAEGELWDRTGAAKKGCFLCGTDGSNPSPSTGESFRKSVSDNENIAFLAISPLPLSRSAVAQGLTSRPRASPASAHHLPDAGQNLLILAGGEISR